MYFDASVVFVTKFSLLFRLAVAILWKDKMPYMVQKILMNTPLGRHRRQTFCKLTRILFYSNFIGKNPKKQKMYQKHIDNFLLHINSESTYNSRCSFD